MAVAPFSLPALSPTANNEKPIGQYQRELARKVYKQLHGSFSLFCRLADAV